MRYTFTVLILFIALQAYSPEYNYKLNELYQHLVLIENTMKWHSDSPSIVRDMRGRRYTTLNSIKKIYEKY